VALLIALETGFPVLYRQERVGQKGKPFTMIISHSRRVPSRNGQAEWAVVNDTARDACRPLSRQARLDRAAAAHQRSQRRDEPCRPRPERPAFVSMLSEQIPFTASGATAVKSGM
jgi:hypothetical protein